jgi:3,4-dihydroxy 2-butanone 4-phosphate synthase/GTP cyclohydrolase II
MTATAAKLMTKPSPFASIEEIVAEARAGRMVIMVDDENRENEGDLILPAAKITPAAVNFMAKYGRGLICLPLEGAIIDRLGLPSMTQRNTSKHGTAFTVSIGARKNTGTGISAADRAQTIQVAADPRSGPEDITVPGHIFPLRSHEGGVHARPGHTEAAIEIARLAGFSGAGVVCEIMNDDGTMARLPDLITFAAMHGLKIGSIADLVDYLNK